MNKLCGFRKHCLSVILCFLLLGSSILLAQDKKPFVGTWNGNIEVESVGFEEEITIVFAMKDDELTGSIDILNQNLEGLLLGEFEIEKKKITFMIVEDGIPGEPTFSGELDKTGKKITGSFTQSGYEGTFTLEKEDK